MLCVKCATQNPPSSRYCSQCNALLPQQAKENDPAGALGIKEGVDYLSPTHHYETDQIVILAELIDGLLEGEEWFDQACEHLEQMASNFKEFEGKYVKEMQALLAREAGKFPDDDYNQQLSYLLKKGGQLFEEGCQAFEQFFDTESDDPEELLAAFEKVRDGNDHYCLSLEMASRRQQQLEEIMAAHPES